MLGLSIYHDINIATLLVLVLFCCKRKFNTVNVKVLEQVEQTEFGKLHNFAVMHQKLTTLITYTISR